MCGGGNTGYLWSKHLFEASTKSQDEVMNILTLEATSSSYFVTSLSPSQNCEFEQCIILEFSNKKPLSGIINTRS
jgi:hypothetical protein